MLYRIHRDGVPGFAGNQCELVYLVSRLSIIQQHNLDWIASDRNAALEGKDVEQHSGVPRPYAATDGRASRPWPRAFGGDLIDRSLLRTGPTEHKTTVEGASGSQGFCPTRLVLHEYDRDTATLGLDDLKRFLTEMPVSSIALPPLGCGNGGLPWSDVRRLITEKLHSLDVTVRLYEPGTPTAEQMVDGVKAPVLHAEHHYLMAGLDRYIQQSWESGIAMTRRMSLIEAHKVAYFLQRVGLPMKLRFDKGHYGPYAPSLDRFLAAAEGHYVRGFGDGTGGARADLWLLPEGKAVAEAAEDEDEFHDAWEQVASRINGYEDPHGMELLASVDYLRQRLSQDRQTPENLRDELTAWSDRKRQVFTAHHVQVALARLTEEPLVQSQ